MAYESEVPQSFRTTYRENVDFLLQQGDSKLLPTVTESDGSGELHKLTDQVGDTKARRKKGRNSNTEYADPKHDGRWVPQPDPIYEAFLVDKQDQLASGIELTGTYAKTAARAIARGTDDIIIGSIYGNAQTGKKGTILTPFDASNIVPVNEGDTTGLNFDKINAAWEILAANFVDVDMEELYMPITARQAGQLRNLVQATSKDYAGSGVEIRDGKINPLVGFKFIHIELGNPLFDNAALTVDENGYRKVPFYTKSGLAAVFWNRLFTSIDRLPTKHFSAQVYASRDVEATRTEEGKVGYILCDES
jgi:hypothetical protein